MLLALTIAASACTAPRHGHRAQVTIDDAHGGGSYIAISSDALLVASGGWSGWLKLWRLPDGKPDIAWRAHQGEVTGISFLQQQRQLISGGYDGKIRLWDHRGQPLAQRDTGSAITHLVVDEAQGIVAAGHRDNRVSIWRLDNLQPIEQRTHHQDWVRAVAIAPGADRFASAGADGSVWSWRAGEPAKRLASPGSDIRTLVFSPDGGQLLGGGWFDLYRWQMGSDQMQRLPTEHGGIINDLRLHPDGKSLVSISRQTDSAVLRLDLASGKTLEYFQPHRLCGASVAISADGRYMASTSDDASVMIWQLLPPTAAGGKNRIPSDRPYTTNQ